MEKHNFVNIQGLERDQLLYLIEMAQEFEKHPNRELLKGKSSQHYSMSLLHEPDLVLKQPLTDSVHALLALPMPRCQVSVKGRH